MHAAVHMKVGVVIHPASGQVEKAPKYRLFSESTHIWGCFMVRGVETEPHIVV
jgi:hypothetical protein